MVLDEPEASLSVWENSKRRLDGCLVGCPLGGLFVLLHDHHEDEVNWTSHVEVTHAEVTVNWRRKRRDYGEAASYHVLHILQLSVCPIQLSVVPVL